MARTDSSVEDGEAGVVTFGQYFSLKSGRRIGRIPYVELVIEVLGEVVLACLKRCVSWASPSIHKSNNGVRTLPLFDQHGNFFVIRLIGTDQRL